VNLVTELDVPTLQGRCFLPRPRNLAQVVNPFSWFPFLFLAFANVCVYTYTYIHILTIECKFNVYLGTWSLTISWWTGKQWCLK